TVISTSNGDFAASVWVKAIASQNLVHNGLVHFNITDCPGRTTLYGRANTLACKAVFLSYKRFHLFVSFVKTLFQHLVIISHRLIPVVVQK
ncbi:MAG: hypothetical protein FWD86_03350, partial [Firmicutes bacterium]|nr:hypothetical protein [Bacillota bacterium]